MFDIGYIIFSAAVWFSSRGEDERVQSLARTIHQQAPSKAARNSLPQLLKLRHVVWLKYIPSGNLT